MHVCEMKKRKERQSNTERWTDKTGSPGFTVLTICEGLEAHLAAVFAKAGHSPCSHLYHVNCTWPEAFHTCSVGLAAEHSGVDLCMVLKEAFKTDNIKDYLLYKNPTNKLERKVYFLTKKYT